MSRSSYTGDCENLALYRGNVDRSIRGATGQARLRELRDDLMAMPIKALEAEIFSKPTGEACALGVWAQNHMADRAAIDRFEGDDYDTSDLLTTWPKLVVHELIYENDRDEGTREYHHGPHQDPSAYWYRHGPIRVVRDETPEARYARVLAWIESQIV